MKLSELKPVKKKKELDELIIEALLLTEDDVPGPTAGPYGGWAPGPFRPTKGGGGMNGNHWFNEFYTTMKNLTIATKLNARLKELGIIGVGADRVSNAAKSAAKAARELLSNPGATAYRLYPGVTTAKPKKVQLKIWNEAFQVEFKRMLKEANLPQ